MTTAPPGAARRGALAALLLLLALGLASWGMAGTFGGPFGRGWLGHNGARYAQIGRNHARLGLAHLRAAPLLDPEPAPGAGDGAPAARPDVYAHHPPGLGLTLGLVFRLTGVDEDAARAVPALATLAALLLLFLLVAGVAGPVTGGVAALLAAAMPMVSVYGAHVDVQGPPVLLFSLATLWAYVRWRRGGGLVPLLAASALASAFDWYGLYAPVGCALHLAWTRPDRRRAALGLCAWTGLLFAAWLTWLLTLPGMTREALGDAAGVRGWGKLLELRDALGPGFAAWRAETSELLLPGWLVLVAVVLAHAVARGLTDRAPVRAVDQESPLGAGGLILLLSVPPLVHGLLFPTGLLQHGYWLFGLPHGLAAGPALLGHAWWRRPPAAQRPTRWLVRGLLLAVAALLVAEGLRSTRALLAEERVDTIPALVGQGLHELTAPGELVLTSFDCNPLEPARAAGYVLKHPAVAFYADRAVRGGIASPEALGLALARLPGADWFLLTPPPGAWVGGAPDPALAAAVAARSEGAPQVLSGDPPVVLHRLAR